MTRRVSRRVMDGAPVAARFRSANARLQRAADARPAHEGRSPARVRSAASAPSAPARQAGAHSRRGGRSPPLASRPGKQKPIGAMAKLRRIVELVPRHAEPVAQPVARRGRRRECRWHGRGCPAPGRRSGCAPSMTAPPPGAAHAAAADRSVCRGRCGRRGCARHSRPAVDAMSGRGAGPGLQLIVPAQDMGEFRRNGDARRLGEVERDQAGDVGDGEVVAGCKARVRQMPVEQAP